MKHPRQIATIGLTTAREIVRNPAYALLVGIGAAMVALSPAFGLFHLGEDLKMAADLGLGTALVVGLLVGVLGSSWTVTDEIESLSVLAVLSKPVSRTVFLLGKYLGVFAAAALAVAVEGLILLFTLRAMSDDAGVFAMAGLAALMLLPAGWFALRRAGLGSLRAMLAALGLVAAALVVALAAGGPLALFGRELAGWRWEILSALAGAVFQVAVLSAVAVALATRLPLAANLSAVLAMFVLGTLASAAGPVAWLAPALDVFQFSDAVAISLSQPEGFRTEVPASAVAMAGAVSAMYVVAALAFGAALLGARDLS